jgi:SsrA-binding protein
MLLTKNRKALYNHTILEKFTAGVVLKGYEVKAIKEHKADFEGAYVQIIAQKPCLVNMHIGRYSNQSNDVTTFEESRTRLLLLNKKEIEELEKEVSQKGKTAVPLALILENGKIKLEFAIVKGKKEFEKKQVAKERQIKRDMEKETKEQRITRLV